MGRLCWLHYRLRRALLTTLTLCLYFFQDSLEDLKTSRCRMTHNMGFRPVMEVMGRYRWWDSAAHYPTF